MRDGTLVLIRPIAPDDKERLQAGLARFSERSRYYRFMTAIRRFSDRQLRYLTEVDQESHVAWIALDPTDPALPLLGVARSIRLPDEPEVAEAAVAVVDSHHGKGLGTILLGLLAAAASRNGIRWFRSHVLTENVAMLHLFRDLGATTRAEGGASCQVDMAVPVRPEELPDTPAGRVFRAVARREVELGSPRLLEPPA